MAGLAKQVGGRAVSYLSVPRGRPPAFYESGHGTTKRYVDDPPLLASTTRMALRTSLRPVEEQLSLVLSKLSARSAEVDLIPVDIHRAVQVGHDADGLADLVSRLAQAPELAEFSGAMHSFGGGAMRITPESLANWLVLRAHSSSPSAAVDSIWEYVTSTSLTMTAVVAVGGVEVAEPIDMGQGTWLIPWSALSASSAKNSFDSSFLMSFAQRPRAALTRQFVLPKQVVHDGEPHVYHSVDYHAHDDVLLLLTLVGPTSAFSVGYWVDPPHHAPIFGLGMTLPHIEGYSPSRQLLPEAGERVQQLSTQWTVLSPARRDELRVPISRLNSAMRRTSPVDAAIDLGIALESFFLSDQSGTQGEMSFRIRMRAARWMGGTRADRERISKLANRLYETRSKAVHTGRLGSKQNLQEIQALLTSGFSLVADSIAKALCGPAIDWEAVLLD